VEEAWEKYRVSMWMGFVLKSKLQGLKEDIRVWNKVEYGNIDLRLVNLREDIEDLDAKGELGILSNEEVEVIKMKFKELWRLWKSKEALWFQRCKSKWLREGMQIPSFLIGV
jgi:hypothetical protein